ncbi:hypothetical protein JCM9279_001759 [Rhodotorula babjevae]
MPSLEAPREHMRSTSHYPAVPLDTPSSSSASPPPASLDFARSPPRGHVGPALPSPSALSQSRPPDHTASTTSSSSSSSSSVDASTSTRTASADKPTTTPDTVTLISTLSASDGESILCIAVDDPRDHPDRSRHGDTHAHGLHSGAGGSRAGRVYGGSQGGSIHVWDLATLSPCARLTGHEGAVLALQLVPARRWLISASGDGTIRVWHTPTLSLVYLLHPPHDNIGDILSLAWLPSDSLEDDEHAGHRRGVGMGHAAHEGGRRGAGRLFAGCQDTSIQWIDLPPTFHLPLSSTHYPPGSPLSSSYASSHGFSTSPHSPPIFKAPNKFFDSLSQTEKNRARVTGLASPGALGGSSGGGGGATPSGLHSKSTANLVGLGASSSRPGTPDGTSTPRAGGTAGGAEPLELQFEAECIVPFAHFGYVYCLLAGKSNERPVLVSGSGDELVKLWHPTTSDLLPVATLTSDCDAVLTLAVRDNTLFAGHQGGVIKVWDLDTLTCVRVLRPHQHDILTLSVLSTSLFSGSASGTLQRWDLRSFALVGEWDAHKSIVLSSEVIGGEGRGLLLTGGNDASLKVWDVKEDGEASPARSHDHGFQGELFHTLAKFVSIKTVADSPHREDCRQGALYLKRVLRSFGAEASLLPNPIEGKNPIVLATFRANAPPRPNRFEAPRRKRVLCYGHYDVVPASAPEMWGTDPFVMHGKDGWLYGRGVSDNKGPVLAVAAAAAERRRKQEMDVDLVMVIEGEEETGSAGFQEAVRKNRDLIGDIDVILVSNSYWLGETVPCLTFGLRGVIHASVKVASSNPEFTHSGIWGGVTSEPLNDLIRVLASLTDSRGAVRIPGFLDGVRKLLPREQKLYDELFQRTDGLQQHRDVKGTVPSSTLDPMQSLINRWRQPALSVHKVEVPGPAQKTLIPNSATASVSIRIVPDQSLDDIVKMLKAHLEKSFGALETTNTLSIDINHVADWWLGDLSSPYVAAMSSCISSQWGLDPLFIREGGSIPSLPFLEREFGADAVHFPMGTSSDSAHLPDERIRVLNLENGKEIVSKWFTKLASLPV